MERKTYLVYRKFYGYLFYAPNTQIGFVFKDLQEGLDEALSPVLFPKKSAASDWRSIVRPSVRLWFGECQTEVREFAMRMEDTKRALFL